MEALSEPPREAHATTRDAAPAQRRASAGAVRQGLARTAHAVPRTAARMAAPTCGTQDQSRARASVPSEAPRSRSACQAGAQRPVAAGARLQATAAATATRGPATRMAQRRGMAR